MVGERKFPLNRARSIAHSLFMPCSIGPCGIGSQRFQITRCLVNRNPAIPHQPHRLQLELLRKKPSSHTPPPISCLHLNSVSTKSVERQSRIVNYKLFLAKSSDHKSEIFRNPLQREDEALIIFSDAKRWKWQLNFSVVSI